MGHALVGCGELGRGHARIGPGVVDELLGHQLAREQLLGPLQVEPGAVAKGEDAVTIGDGGRECGPARVRGGPAPLENAHRRLSGRLGAHRRRLGLRELAGRHLATEADARRRRPETPLSHDHGRAHLLGLRAVVAGIEPHDHLAGPDDLVVAHQDLDHLPGNLGADGCHRALDVRVIGVDAQPAAVPRRARPAGTEEHDQAQRDDEPPTVHGSFPSTGCACLSRR